MNPRTTSLLNDIFLFAMMLVIAEILIFAMALQYKGGEIPCPLCLLQRVAMFGVCFGIIQHFRGGTSGRGDGISMIFAVLLLIISVRQTLLDIYPRPGHAYIGSAIFNIHMPVWSVIIAICILFAFAVKYAVLGGTTVDDNERPEWMTRTAAWLGYFVVAICAINFVSVVLQCGLDACHTMSYRLL
ncbi:MAG: disulfide bond formation protein B [Pseudomonadota bacterium]